MNELLGDEKNSELQMVAVGYGTAVGARLGADELRALYLDDVFRYVSAFVRPPEEAEDVTMSVFHAAFTSIGRMRGEPRLWLLGIARRKVADSLRSRYRRREDRLSPLLAQSQQNIDDTVVIGEVLGQITADHAQILVLKYVNELSTEEIAKLIGKSNPATNSLLQRAREAFYAKGAAHFLPSEDLS